MLGFTVHILQTEKKTFENGTDFQMTLANSYAVFARKAGTLISTVQRGLQSF